MSVPPRRRLESLSLRRGRLLEMVGWVVVALLVAAAVSFGLYASRSTTQRVRVEPPPVVDAVPPEEDVAPPVVDVAPPVVDVAPLEVDVAPLTKPPKASKPKLVKLVEPAKRWVVMAPGCEPDDRWREDAMRTLRELGEIAAENPRKWKDYQRKEALLTRAINTASDRVACGQASQQIGEVTDAILMQ